MSLTQIPTDRNSLTPRDWFLYVLSKLCPLEWWHYAEKSDDICRLNFREERGYQIELPNTWSFPRFAFGFFRAQPDLLKIIRSALEEYRSTIRWTLDSCGISAYSAQPLPMAPTRQFDNRNLEYLMDLARNPPQADPNFVANAVADIPSVCRFLENRLGLREIEPQQFDPEWLTREGLAGRPAGFVDFDDGGDWALTVLTPDPQGAEFAFDDNVVLMLHFGITMAEAENIFEELGADWSHHTSNGSLPLIPAYPLISQFDDVTGSVNFEPVQVRDLESECLRAQSVVQRPLSVRGLDKLLRTARWAKQLGYGIHVGEQ